MKTIKHITITLLMLTLTISGFGQQLTFEQALKYKSGDPSDWPPALESIIAAPKNHKVLMENDKVRVLEVTVAPGEKENLHFHKWPSVLYVQEVGDFIDADADGNIIFDSRDIPGPLNLPMTMWKEAEAPHSVTNLSKTTAIRLIRVEMKQ